MSSQFCDQTGWEGRVGPMIRVKYPRTPHLPWSPGATSDDRVLADVSGFVGRRVVVTEKMDGENTTIYPDGSFHARSLDSGQHPSRSYVASVAARVGPLLDEGMRVCGENLFAVHSIAYPVVPDWFVVFGVWDGPVCLSWDDTVVWADLLGLTTVPVLYDGPWDETVVRDLCVGERDGRPQEGVVVRVADAFTRDQFGVSVAKWVRAGHVTTDEHWMFGEIRRNPR